VLFDIDQRQRTLDLLLVGVAVVPLSFLGALIAIAIKMTSPGPVLFRQRRVGRDGERFVLLKFRSMTDGENPLIPDDARITGVGRVLRSLGLDELPQVINVAKGQMSFVGPRPMLEFQAERCSGRQCRRFDVRPGLTGLAQISGRNGLTWPERIEIDLEYIATRTTRTDLAVIIKTPVALLSQSGVEGHQAMDPFVREAPDA